MSIKRGLRGSVSSAMIFEFNNEMKNLFLLTQLLYHDQKPLSVFNPHCRFGFNFLSIKKG